MRRESSITMTGVITDRMPSDRFGVRTEDGQNILATVSTRLWRDAHLFRIGDRVTLDFNLDHPVPGKIFHREPGGKAESNGETTDPAHDASRTTGTGSSKQ
jgi:translation initiation factor IF-1